MATGTAGSSFTSELNRLANSGTYPALTAYLAATGAANDYANTTGKALIGALNLAADANRQPNNFKAAHCHIWTHIKNQRLKYDLCSLT